MEMDCNVSNVVTVIAKMPEIERRATVAMCSTGIGTSYTTKFSIF